MTRVLVADDSPTVRDLLVYILASDPEIEIVGCAADGEEAVRLALEKRPDVITMDLHMPGMDGFEATRRIMETCPTPIVVVSGSAADDEAEASFRAIEAGALVIVQRPHGPGNAAHHQTASALIRTVKSMAEVKVVRRWPKEAAKAPAMDTAIQIVAGPRQRTRQLVLIGASTGGPAVIAEILAQLPGKSYPLPIVIVQHMAAGFAAGFADWLRSASGFPVVMAGHGDRLEGGRAYLAPDGFQIAVDRELHVVLSRAGAEHGMCPSVSHLFRSVPAPLRAATVAVLLTGMGKDGAQELRGLKESGALTMVQDRATAAVYGMPGEALKRDAATLVLAPLEIGKTLHALGQKPASGLPLLNNEGR
jgi:two-component system chemotaxis response regulator CheB